MTKQILAFAAVLTFLAGCQESDSLEQQPASGAVEGQPVSLVRHDAEVACGECQFGMEGSGCDLAVRIDGDCYYVDGASIDDFGDAHASDGMCLCIRKAKIEGEIKDGRFVASSIELLPLDETKQAEEAQEKLRQSPMGASFGIKGGKLIVNDIWEQGLGAQAGLLLNDEIVKLNGQPVEELDSDALKAVLTESESIEFTVLRNGEETLVQVDVGG